MISFHERLGVLRRDASARSNPDGACEQLWCHSDLRRKPALELTGAKAGFCNTVLDPRAAAGGDHHPGREADRAVLRAAFEHRPDPALDNVDALSKITCHPHRIAKRLGGFA